MEVCVQFDNSSPHFPHITLQYTLPLYAAPPQSNDTLVTVLVDTAGAGNWAFVTRKYSLVQ